ncbi:surface-adhesin E family protein [Acinetobacter tjernbergiae]|nr:surface-adhesin E family protein [Acinetobacter tjernbergiae]
MKKFILACGLIIPSISFGADWGYVVSTDDTSYWIDKEFYKYDFKNNKVDIWVKSVSKKSNEMKFYTKSKLLNRYSCINKEYRNIAYSEYTEDNKVTYSASVPEENIRVIFPETIAEELWKVACKTKGKGLKFTKYQQQIVDVSTLEVQ